MRICKGESRLVFLIGKWAIKIPRLNSWRLFLYGLLGNIHEYKWTKDVEPEVKPFLCPIIFYTPGGFLSIMPRCEQSHNLYNLFYQSYKYKSVCTVKLLSDIVEDKDSSVGIYNGRVVAIDYGS